MREDFAFHLSDDGKLLAIEYLSPYLSPSVCAEYLNVRWSTTTITTLIAFLPELMIV